MKRKDVTEDVEFGWNDDEYLPLRKCVCGAKFFLWGEVLTVEDEDPLVWECPECGSKLYFRNRISVFQILEEEK